MASEKKKNHPLKSIGFFILAAIFGFGLGIVSAMLIPNPEIGGNIYNIALTVFSFFIGYFVHFVVHEAGHLVFGLLSGYSFVSFRVGNFTIMKENGKLKTARMGIPGTGGQCLMSPPGYNNGNFPYILYNLGGALFNVIFSALALIAVRESFPLLINMLLVGFALAGLFVALTNAFPHKSAGVPTDGYNILSMRKDSGAKRAFWAQLKVNDLIAQGVRPKDLSPDLFEMNDEDWTNPLKTSLQLLQYNVYLDQMDFEQAKESLDELVPHMDELIPIYRNEINSERLFLELIGENNSAVIQEIYDEELIQYIQATKNWPNKKRTLMAYEIFQRQDTEKALEYYRELMEVAARYPNKGEAEMEMMLANWLKEKVEEER